MAGSYIHIYYKTFCGAALYVVNEISKGKVLILNSTFMSFFELLKFKGDNLIFHARDSITASIPFLIFNKISKRNRIAYQPHTNFRSNFTNKIFSKFVDRILCLTEYNKNELVKNGINNCIVIPNPIPIKRLEYYKKPKVSEKIYDVAWAGRDVDVKRMELFIDCVKHTPNTKAIILTHKINETHKRLLQGLKNITLKEGLTGADFFEELDKAKWFVFTSDKREGFPIILLEVTWLGIPTISTDNEKYREILQNIGLFWKDKSHLISLLDELPKKSNPLNKSKMEKILRPYLPEVVYEKYNSW